MPLKAHPLFSPDSQFSNDLPNQANSNIAALVGWDGNNLTRLGMDHALVLATGNRTLKAKLL